MLCFNNNMKITAIQNDNNRYSKQQNFTGLTKAFRRQIYIDGKKDILEIINLRSPKQNSYVGQLPPYIFESLPKDKLKRTAAIKDILNTFSEIANEIRSFKPSAKLSGAECKNRRSNSTVEKLKNLFEKYKLKNTDEDVDIKFLGRGDYGSAFKLEGILDTVTNDRYMFKTHTVADSGPEWHRFKSHGCYAEPNSAVYWINKWGQNTQRGKFYCADVKSGFMIDNFIDDTTPMYKRTINEYRFGVKLTDEALAAYGHNKINNYSIDWGGLRVVNRIKNQSKIACAVLEKIKKTEPRFRTLEWYKFLYCNRQYDKVQKKAGLALSIKHLNDKEKYIEECLSWHEPMVDQALSYVLKYLPHEQALKYFEKLMTRNEEITQTILMNEIPLLARKPLPEAYDDMLVPKSELYPDKIKIFYDLANKHVKGAAKEHLASYVHLLPHDAIIPEFRYLLSLDDYDTYDRLLHKIRSVPEEEFPFDLKFQMLDEIIKSVKDPYLKKYAQDLKIYTLRKTLGGE